MDRKGKDSCRSISFILIAVLTIMWDYSPGHSRCIYSSNHPEHAEPAEVLTTLLLGQKFRIVGKHDGDRATDSVKFRKYLSREVSCLHVNMNIYTVLNM